MWAVYTVLGYFLLALLVPVGWALGHVWRRAREPRHLTCPDDSVASLVGLDPWYAVREHTLGEPEVRVRECTRWPERRECGQECLRQIGDQV